MEHNEVLLQAYNRQKNIELNEGISVFPQQEQKNEPTPGTLEPQSAPAMLAFIEFRLQQLDNRRFLLMETQRFRVKPKDGEDEATEDMNIENSDRLCELDIIQKEVKVLLEKRKELQKLINPKPSDVPQGQQKPCSTSHEAEKPSGEIFIVSPPENNHENNRREQNTVTAAETERKTGPVVPVEKLRREADVTQCPSCKEVVFTVTKRKVGEAMCLASCLCAMVGCVAGCCFIPFCLESLKNVHHKCPQCHAHLYTHNPF